MQGQITQDRKAGAKKSCFIRRANVSIATGTQPETLRVDSSGNIHNGLLPRFLLAMPPRQKLVWSEKEVPEHVGMILSRVYSNLLAIEPGIDDRGAQYPIDLPLTPEAKGLFASFLQSARRGASRIDRRSCVGMEQTCRHTLADWPSCSI